MAELSVIITLSPNKTAWQSLPADPAKFPDGTEIHFVVQMTSIRRKCA